MLRGWFDAFRSHGGPTLYSDTNRTAAVDDLRSLLVYLSFGTLLVGFLIIFPGIRKEKFSTLVCVTTSLFVGAVLLLSNFGTDWHVATGTISSQYRAFSREKLHADVGVRIGLNSVNVTLKASSNSRWSDEDINYNEQFKWIGASQMQSEYRNALTRGLPFPILTIAEYLSHNNEGFSWGAKYRKAGFYTSVILWWAFAMWLISNILLCMVPCYGAYTMFITGIMMLCANGLYVLMLPKHPPLEIHFETQRLTFHFGWCFWIVVTAGALAAIVGGIVSLVDTFFPNKFSTIFEVDYDTPYRYFVGQDANYATPTTPANSPRTAGANSEAFTKYRSRSMVTPTTRGQHRALVSSPNLSTGFLTRSPGVSSVDGLGNSSPGFLARSPGVSSVDGLINSGFDEGDDDDRGSTYGTIVNGKRAVSLRNFGKFAQKEASRKRPFGLVPKKPNGLSLPSRSSHVNIDLQTASMW